MYWLTFVWWQQWYRQYGIIPESTTKEALVKRPGWSLGTENVKQKGISWWVGIPHAILPINRNVADVSICFLVHLTRGPHESIITTENCSRLFHFGRLNAVFVAVDLVWNPRLQNLRWTRHGFAVPPQWQIFKNAP